MSPSQQSPDNNSARKLPGQNLLLSALFVGLLASFVLLINSQLVDLSRLHFGSIDRHLNDQVGYITTARNLLETGVLSSNIIYPSTLYQETTKNYLYMPGHYYALAVSFLLFGTGIIQSYLPNLISFVLTSICVLLIGAKLHTLRVGFIAVLMFMFYPINIIYAYSAMSEMTFVFAASLAFCIFIYLPQKTKPFLGPFLLILPFLFREFGIFLALPMALVIYDYDHRQILKAMLFLCASFAVNVLVYLSDISSGRPSLILANLFDDRLSTIYNDAVAQQAISPQLVDWPLALVNKFVENVRFILDSVLGFNLSLDILFVAVVVGIGIVSVYYGIRNKLMYPLASGAFILASFIIVMGLYTLYGYRGIRMLLFTYPMAAIVLALLFDHYILGRRIDGIVYKRTANFLNAAFGIAIVAIVLNILVVKIMFEKFSSFDHLDDLHTRFLEQIGHDDSRMLVAPFDMSFDYVYRHYPVEWSFIPANEETLGLLDSQYNIGTVIIPHAAFINTFVEEDFTALNLLPESPIVYDGEEYVVFKRQ